MEKMEKFKEKTLMGMMIFHQEAKLQKSGMPDILTQRFNTVKISHDAKMADCCVFHLIKNKFDYKHLVFFRIICNRFTIMLINTNEYKDHVWQ